MKDFTPLKECNYCHQGIGLTIFQCKAILTGEYCSGDCYANALDKEYKLGGLIGRFNLTSDRQGVYLSPNN